MRIQEVVKKLNQSGLTKAIDKRVDFQTVSVGDYEAREFNHNGIMGYILPKNGMTCERIMDILADEHGISSGEKNGYVVIYK